MILDCQRKVTQLDRTVREGQWDIYACGDIQRISGMTYGLMAFGNIPRKVVELMRPFGVKFMAYDPFVADEKFAEYGVERAETVEELFAACDMISVHTPLLPSTRHMIGKEQLAKAKPGMVLVCTGRGGVIDEDALKEALENGTIRTAAVDVIEAEGAAESVLIGMENVIITPHVAYYSEGSLVDGVKVEMEFTAIIDE